MADEQGQLRDRLERAFQGRSADAFGRFKAIVGPTDLRAFGELAEQARVKLRERKELSPQERAALELALRVVRPAPLTRKGQAGPIPQECIDTFPRWAAFTGLVKPLLPSIGRIDGTWGTDEAGTGFLVSSRLLVTNRHVLDAISFGAMVLERGQAVVRFHMEQEGSTESRDVLRAVAVHPTADLALLEIDEARGAVPLSFAEGKAAVGDPVVAIGFPAADTRRNPFFVPLIFGDTFGLKRTSPGELLSVGEGSVYHDCSTLGGNSGSPILSMESGRVVGVHREGTFMYRNGAVDAETARAFVSAHLGSAT